MWACELRASIFQALELCVCPAVAALWQISLFSPTLGGEEADFTLGACWGGEGVVIQVVDPSPFFCSHWEAFVPLLMLPLGEDINLPK